MKAKFLFIFLIFLIVFSSNTFSSELIENELKFEGELEINYFYSFTCPACSQMTPFLESMQHKYGFKLNKYELSNPVNSRLFLQKLNEFNVPADMRGYVPTTFTKSNYLVGYSPEQFENIIMKELNIINEIDNNLPISDKNDSISKGELTKVETTIFGLIPISVNLSGDTFLSLLTSTILLAFLDSLNVCSITVLLFLIIYLLSIGSVKRVLKTGLIFTTIIYLFYFSFMLFLSTLISLFILEYGFYIRATVILFASLAGILLIKDYFFYGVGPSLAVPKSAKPLLEKYLKQATLISTIIFALLASIVELPCTAVFPMIYSTILAESMITGLEVLPWIALYNLIYVLPLLLLVLGTYFSWINIHDVDKKIQKNKKLLKLISGIVLIIIAIYFMLPWVL